MDLGEDFGLLGIEATEVGVPAVDGNPRQRLSCLWVRGGKQQFLLLLGGTFPVPAPRLVLLSQHLPNNPPWGPFSTLSKKEGTNPTHAPQVAFLHIALTLVGPLELLHSKAQPGQSPGKCRPLAQ